MSIRLGASPIIWSNDDHARSSRADTPLEDLHLAQARQVGFEGMELGHKFPRDQRELASILGRFGLACVSGWYSAELLTRDAHVAELHPSACCTSICLKTLGSTVLVFADVSGAVHSDQRRPLSERPLLKAGDWRDFGRRITQVAAATAAEGVRLAYHHHMGTVVQSEADIDTLMDVCGAEVGLLLDTGHAAFAGADPVSLARRYASRIWHVHAKDVRAAVCARARSENWSFLRAVVAGVFTVPGDGSVAFERVFHELRNYSGWVILEAEQDPGTADPLSYAALGYRNLRRLVAEMK